MIRLGPFLFFYTPDGDDPGVGWLGVDNHPQAVPTTRAGWDRFVAAVKR